MGLTPGQTMSPGVANLFTLLELVAPPEVTEEFKRLHQEGKLLYRDLKETLFRHLMEVLRPIRERRKELEAKGEVEEILAAGAEKARKIAKEVIKEVRARVGLD